MAASRDRDAGGQGTGAGGVRQVTADRDFGQELEVKLNTRLTRGIGRLTTGVHNHLEVVLPEGDYCEHMRRQG